MGMLAANENDSCRRYALRMPSATPNPRGSRRCASRAAIRRVATWVAALVLAAAVSACGGTGTGTGNDRPTVVVTYSVLGALVRDAVGDAADVSVLIPDGSDPHEWEPSARDIERVNHADLIVRNGLGLEGGVLDVLDIAEDEGVPTFVASDHVHVRTVGDGEGLPGGDDDQSTGAPDPHLWMDPLTMRDVVAALGPALAAQGIDATAGVARVVAGLEQLDTQVDAVLAPIPPADRILVTGHESLGYFADRYGFRLVGAIVSSLTTQADVSAKELAHLADAIRREGVTAVFIEIGTSRQIADAISDETGAQVVELASHNLPDDGTYATFMLDNARKVAAALTAAG